MKRYLIDFSYAGENFYGYQKQPGLRTTQGEIERVLTMINENPVTIYASGRTDAKVNALHQMAHFDLEKNILPLKLKGALNSYLPNDVYVNEVKLTTEDFHARYMVKSKTYEYKINMGTYNPLLRTQVYQYGKPLNVKKIKEAVIYLKGTHDFTTFTCAEDKRTNKVRTINEVNVADEDNVVTITFVGNGFLKYQVRNMVGLLIKVGEEKFDPNDIPALFSKRDRRLIFNTAPPEGLTLVKVSYQ